jgi:hypothetical protein
MARRMRVALERGMRSRNGPVQQTFETFNYQRFYVALQ